MSTSSSSSSTVAHGISVLPAPPCREGIEEGSAFTLVPLALSGYVDLKSIQQSVTSSGSPADTTPTLHQGGEGWRKEWIASVPGMIAVAFPSIPGHPIAQHVALLAPLVVYGAVKPKSSSPCPPLGLSFTPTLPESTTTSPTTPQPLALTLVAFDALASHLFIAYSRVTQSPSKQNPQNGGILVYLVANVLNKHFVPIAHVSNLPSGCKVYPNPEAFPHLFAVLAPPNSAPSPLLLFDVKVLEKGGVTGITPPPTHIASPSNGTDDTPLITSMCWSKKGKQLVFGTSTGYLYQSTPSGEIKNTILPPIADPSPLSVQHVFWCEDRVFMAGYAFPLQEGETTPDVAFYAVTQEKGSPLTKYTPLEDPAPAFGNDQRPIAYYMTSLTLSGGSEWKHILIYGNSPSADLGIIGYSTATNSWANLFLSNPITLPLDDVTGEDTWIVGMTGLDMSRYPAIQSAFPLPDVPGAGGYPVFMMYLNNGAMFPLLLKFGDRQLVEGLMKPPVNEEQVLLKPLFVAPSSSRAASAAAAPAFGAGISSAFSTTGLGSELGKRSPATTGSLFGKPDDASSQKQTTASPVGTVASSGGGFRSSLPAAGSPFGKVADGASKASPSVAAPPQPKSAGIFGSAAFGTGVANPVAPFFGKPSETTDNAPSSFSFRDKTVAVPAAAALHHPAKEAEPSNSISVKASPPKEIKEEPFPLSKDSSDILPGQEILAAAFLKNYQSFNADLSSLKLTGTSAPCNGSLVEGNKDLALQMRQSLGKCTDLWSPHLTPSTTVSEDAGNDKPELTEMSILTASFPSIFSCALKLLQGNSGLIEGLVDCEVKRLLLDSTIKGLEMHEDKDMTPLGPEQVFLKKRILSMYQSVHDAVTMLSQMSKMSPNDQASNQDAPMQYLHALQTIQYQCNAARVLSDKLDSMLRIVKVAHGDVAFERLVQFRNTFSPAPLASPSAQKSRKPVVSPTPKATGGRHRYGITEPGEDEYSDEDVALESHSIPPSPTLASVSNLLKHVDVGLFAAQRASKQALVQRLMAKRGPKTCGRSVHWIPVDRLSRIGGEELYVVSQPPVVASEVYVNEGTQVASDLSKSFKVDVGSATNPITVMGPSVTSKAPVMVEASISPALPAAALLTPAALASAEWKQQQPPAWSFTSPAAVSSPIKAAKPQEPVKLPPAASPAKVEFKVPFASATPSAWDKSTGAFKAPLSPTKPSTALFGATSSLFGKAALPAVATAESSFLVVDNGGDSTATGLPFSATTSTFGQNKSAGFSFSFAAPETTVGGGSDDSRSLQKSFSWLGNTTTVSWSKPISPPRPQILDGDEEAEEVTEEHYDDDQTNADLTGASDSIVPVEDLSAIGGLSLQKEAILDGLEGEESIGEDFAEGSTRLKMEDLAVDEAGEIEEIKSNAIEEEDYSSDKPSSSLFDPFTAPIISAAANVPSFGVKLLEPAATPKKVDIVTTPKKLEREIVAGKTPSPKQAIKPTKETKTTLDRAIRALKTPSPAKSPAEALVGPTVVSAPLMASAEMGEREATPKSPKRASPKKEVSPPAKDLFIRPSPASEVTQSSVEKCKNDKPVTPVKVEVSKESVEVGLVEPVVASGPASFSFSSFQVPSMPVAKPQTPGKTMVEDGVPMSPDDNGMDSDMDGGMDMGDVEGGDMTPVNTNVFKPAVFQGSAPSSAFGTPSGPAEQPLFGSGKSVFGAAPAASSFSTPPSAPVRQPGSTFGAKPVAPVFGSSAFGSATPAQTAKPSAFGTPAATSSFGSAAFGGSSANATPSFASFAQQSSAFGAAGPSTPAFGSTSFGTPAFGSSSLPAAPIPAFVNVTTSASNAPVFGSSFASTAAQQPTSFGSVAFGSGGPAFGSTSFGSSVPATTPFGGVASNAPVFGSSFGATASGGGGGFGAVGGGSPFASVSTGASQPSPFGQMPSTPSAAPSSSLFGQSGFKQNPNFTTYR